MPIPPYVLARLEKKDPKYKNVEVRGCRLDDKEAELLITKILENPQVESVDFSNNILSNNSVKCLSLLPETIKILDLSRNNIDDDAIPSILKDIKIKEIDLSYNNIGIKSLPYLKANKDKTYLNVAHTGIPSDDAIEIYKIAQSNRSKILATQDNQLAKNACKDKYDNISHRISSPSMSSV